MCPRSDFRSQSIVSGKLVDAFFERSLLFWSFVFKCKFKDSSIGHASGFTMASNGSLFCLYEVARNGRRNVGRGLSFLFSWPDVCKPPPALFDGFGPILEIRTVGGTVDGMHSI